MTKRQQHSVEFLDGCHHSSHEEIADFRHPIICDGTHYAAAVQFQGAIEEYRSGDMRVCIMLGLGNGRGLYIGLTPDGARNYATALNRMAAIVDGQVAQQAAAAIDKARNSKGKPQ